MTKRQNFSKVAGTADGCQLSQLIYLNICQCWFGVLKKRFFPFCVNYNPISPPTTPVKVHVFSDSNRKALLRKLNWHQRHFSQKAMFHQPYQKPFIGHLPAYFLSPLRQTWSIMSSSSFKDTCSSKHNCQDTYRKSSKNWCNGNILLME